MRKICYILAILLGLTWQSLNAQSYEPGVSKVLAEQRVQNISDVHYDLTFDIPDNLQVLVSGNAVISFNLARKSEVVLDFQGNFTGTCIVNGKQCILTMENEHIIIPAELVAPGANTIDISFVSLDKALNRNPEYMYSLFVPDQARSCFPCFDQPDMRATFNTTLNVPQGWKTMVSDGRYPIPTYLYSFVAGKFEEQTARREGYPIRALYREQDPQKVAQLSKVFDEIGGSLHWMEG